MVLPTYHRWKWCLGILESNINVEKMLDLLNQNIWIWFIREESGRIRHLRLIEAFSVEIQKRHQAKFLGFFPQNPKNLPLCHCLPFLFSSLGCQFNFRLISIKWIPLSWRSWLNIRNHCLSCSMRNTSNWNQLFLISASFLPSLLFTFSCTSHHIQKLNLEQLSLTC